jgi:hypothetical protein
VSLPEINFGGVTRRLGTLPYFGPRKFKTAKEAGIPDVPKSDWYEINRRAEMPWILDQQQHGSCTGHGLAGALMRARRLRGLTHFMLSGAYPYSLVNGGYDNGAMIHDLLAVGIKNGTCLLELCGWDQIYPRQYDKAKCAKSALRFRIESAYVAENFNQIASGLILDYIPAFAVMVGNSFATLDGNGVAGFDRGPGNHAVHADGLKNIGGEWVLDMVNSWGESFGQNGRCYLTQRHIDDVQQDCYMIKASIEDPEEPSPVPPGE